MSYTALRPRVSPAICWLLVALFLGGTALDTLAGKSPCTCLAEECEFENSDDQRSDTDKFDSFTACHSAQYVDTEKCLAANPTEQILPVYADSISPFAQRGPPA